MTATSPKPVLDDQNANEGTESHLRKISRRNRRNSGNRYSSDERARIISDFTLSRAQGISAVDAARGLQASLASIYRWRQSIIDSDNNNDLAKIVSRYVDNAIRVLVDSHSSRLQRIEAICNFIVWLRWPTRPEAHFPAVLCCLTNYFATGNEMRMLNQMDEVHISVLLRYLSIDNLKRSFSDLEVQNDSFRSYPLDDQPYFESDLLAEVVWFLLGYKIFKGEKEQKASLRKAYFASQKGVFTYRWRVSEKVFQDLWHVRGSASPFFFIEKFHSSINFDLIQQNENFRLDVDELIDDHDRLRSYFMRVKWILQELERRLDVRALDTLCFPSLPDTLVSEQVELQALSSKINTIMRGYDLA